MMTSVVCFNPV